MKSVFVVQHEHILDGDELFAITTVLENMFFGDVIVSTCNNQPAQSGLIVPNAFPNGKTFTIPAVLQDAHRLRMSTAEKERKAKEKRVKTDGQQQA